MTNKEELIEQILLDLMEIFNCDRTEAENKLIEICDYIKK